MQEELIAELTSERARQQMLVQEQEKSRRRANGTTTAAAAAAGASTALGGRSLRSTAGPGEAGEGGATNAYSREYPYSRSLVNGNGNGNGTSNGAGSSSGTTVKKRSAAAPSLDHVLPENSMRSVPVPFLLLQVLS